MAVAGGYYSQAAPPPALSAHLCFFMATVLMLVGITWYINYDSVLEGIIDQIKLLLMLSPLLLLLCLHLLSRLEKSPPRLFFLRLPERDSLHRAGTTPWGVGLLLVLLLFMISYQSDFRERWFPLLRR